MSRVRVWQFAASRLQVFHPARQTLIHNVVRQVKATDHEGVEKRGGRRLRLLLIGTRVIYVASLTLRPRYLGRRAFNVHCMGGWPEYRGVTEIDSILQISRDT